MINLDSGQSITIADGATTGTVTFTAQSEDVFIDAETATYAVDTVVNNGTAYENLITTDTVSVNILDTVDDTTVSLTGPASVNEGDTVTITATVDNAPSGGSLVINLDNGQSITIADGATTGTVTFTAQSEDVFIDAETATYAVDTVVNNGTAYENLITTDTVSVNILDTVDNALISIAGPGTVSEGSTTGTYTVTIRDAANNPVNAVTAVTVALNYSGTASDGSDFTGVANVTIPAGSSIGTFDIATLTDVLAEGTEDFTVTLGAITGGSTAGGFENLIVDTANDDVTTSIVEAVIVTINDVSVNEGTGTATISASVSDTVTGTPFVITLSDGKTITIPVGATTGTSAPFAIQGDDVFVDGSTDNVTITGTSGGSFAAVDTSDGATITVNDTTDNTTVSLTGPASVNEGDTVTITATVDNAPSGGSLVINLDNGQSITIADGATTGTVTFTAQSEDVFIDAETATYAVDTVVNNGTAYENLITTDTVSVNILDTVDNALISIAGPGTVSEGSTTGTYTVTIRDAANNPVNAVTAVTVALNYSGTASDGSDFTGVANVTIPAGSSIGTFDIATLTDVLAEGTEDFTVTLGAITGGSTAGGFENLIVDTANDDVTTSIVEVTTPPIDDQDPNIADQPPATNEPRDPSDNSGNDISELAADGAVVDAVTGANSLNSNSELGADGAVLDAVSGANNLGGTSGLDADGAVLEAVENANVQRIYFGDNVDSKLADGIGLWDAQGIKGYAVSFSLTETSGGEGDLSSLFPLRVGGLEAEARDQLLVKSILRDRTLFLEVDYSINSNPNLSALSIQVLQVNGSPLPEWLRLDDKGRLVSGEPPVGAENVELRIEVNLSDGTKVIRYVDVNVNSGEIAALEQIGDEMIAGASLFENQIEKEAIKFDNASKDLEKSLFN